MDKKDSSGEEKFQARHLVTPSRKRPGWVGQHVGWTSRPLHSQLGAGACGKRKGPPIGHRIRLQTSRVLLLEDSCPTPGTSGAQGLRRPPPGGRKLPPPRGEGAKALHREGTRVYKQGGGSARERAPEELGEGLQIARSLARLFTGSNTHPARCRPSRPVQPPPAPAPGFVVLLLQPPPPPPDPARAVAAATGTRPHNAFLFAPPPAHTALRHAAVGGRAGEQPKT